MILPTQVAEFILGPGPAGAPPEARHAAKRSLLDLLGVLAAGLTTPCSQISRDAAVTLWPSTPDQGATLLLDGRRVNACGAAFAGGQTIDSIDAHDGFKPAKGHAGVAVLPALLSVMEADGDRLISQEFLDALILGYEIACRTAIAQHRTCPDFHSSGAWNSAGAAAVAARLLGLDACRTREALGIAEYYGPRSQIMRVVDYPSMVKDGSGWGAMTGVAAVYLARAGLTGAPVLTLESRAVADIWDDLGSRWRITEQYFKLWPVCRWAQPAVQAALQLAENHALAASDIEAIEVVTFHEACRLGNAIPTTTDEAQYAIAFPTACAFVRGRVGVDEIAGSGLQDVEVRALVERITLREDAAFNAAFPANRRAKVTVRLRSGAVLESDIVEPPGDPEHPLTDQQVIEKFYSLAAPVLGHASAARIERAVGPLDGGELDLPALLTALRTPPTS